MHKLIFTLFYYCSITPTCFGPLVEAIIREFKKPLELQSPCGDLLRCYVYVFTSRCDCCGMLWAFHSNHIAT